MIVLKTSPKLQQSFYFFYFETNANIVEICKSTVGIYAIFNKILNNFIQIITNYVKHIGHIKNTYTNFKNKHIFLK